MTLNFYEIDENYLNYLRQVESKVPNTSYAKNKKFFCGVIISVDGYDYFAPISSNKKKLPTTYPIYNKAGEILGTIVLKFMIPVKNEHVNLKIIANIQDEKYQDLVSKELTFCREKEKQIKAAAKRVHSYGTNSSHNQYKYCCKFKVLETALDSYTG